MCKYKIRGKKTPKHRQQKENKTDKSDFFKIKNICASKDTINSEESAQRTGKNICKLYTR